MASFRGHDGNSKVGNLIDLCGVFSSDGRHRIGFAALMYRRPQNSASIQTARSRHTVVMLRPKIMRRTKLITKKTTITHRTSAAV
jgi:hypothetical protein